MDLAKGLPGTLSPAADHRSLVFQLESCPGTQIRKMHACAVFSQTMDAQLAALFTNACVYDSEINVVCFLFCSLRAVNLSRRAGCSTARHAQADLLIANSRPLQGLRRPR